ncbi:ABC transporter substrate-binding protein [Paraglaciecola sp. L3A3]|uniref:ABC transporter substrate-binding protein n=1 Tax=Paraglaciecola sp. L3A3 TaxID=2686358 RepID=UPI00131BBCB5|nr:ABC transporter substrate-binding protein [Paraglaciecola sp. L3A3]
MLYRRFVSSLTGVIPSIRKISGVLPYVILTIWLATIHSTVAQQLAGQSKEQAIKSAVIAFPFDVESWDPTSRVIPHTTSLYKLMFDQPLAYDADNQLTAAVIKNHAWLDDKGLTLSLQFRDDVYFHNGDKLTSEDFKYTFFDRPQQDKTIQLGYIWGSIVNIETPSPTQAIIHFNKPFVTALQYLAFAGAFILPKDYLEKVGIEKFLEHPIGSGPYKLISYQRNNRISLQAFDKYWAGKPKIEKLTVQITPSSTSRIAALQSAQVDLSYALPIRDSKRMGNMPKLTSALSSTIDTYLIHMVNRGPLKDINVRLAMHYAINKTAISKALLAGISKPISSACPPTTPCYQATPNFDYDPAKAIEYLKQSGYSSKNPVKFTFFATKGVSPADNLMARAIMQMWKKVGIEAKLETIDFAKFFQKVADNSFQGPVLWLWNNSTGDPELYAGTYLNANNMFSVWRSEEVMQRLTPLLSENNYSKRIEKYKDFNKWIVEQGFSIPLLEGINSVVHNSSLPYKAYRNGWLVPNNWD